MNGEYISLETASKIAKVEQLRKIIRDYIKTELNQRKEIERLHSIIKEIREYIEYQLENLDFEEDTKAKMLGAMVLVLLDKENNNVKN